VGYSTANGAKLYIPPKLVDRSPYLAAYLFNFEQVINLAHSFFRAHYQIGHTIAVAMCNVTEASQMPTETSL